MTPPSVATSGAVRGTVTPMTLLDAITPKPERRLRRLVVSPELILDLLHVPPEGTVIDGKHIVCVRDPIPRTAKPAKVGFDDRGDLTLWIEDESFTPIMEGGIVPQITPWFEEGKWKPPELLKWSPRGDWPGAIALAESRTGRDWLVKFMPNTQRDWQARRCGGQVEDDRYFQTEEEAKAFCEGAEWLSFFGARP